MGVRGLSTFLRDNRQSLCTSVQFASTPNPTTKESRTPVVVDTYGIIFQLYLDSLPWTSGGEYLRFYRLTRRFVESLRKVGLEPYFVFDGSAPFEKHDTLLGRIKQQYKTALLFYTTSVPSRSAPSFSRSTTILPPFAVLTFIYALSALDVSTHFVPVGEADGVCVSLANELGGYIMGNDSDFIILISSPGASRVKGYCPLDMMQWIEGNPSTTTRTSTPEPEKGSNEWYHARPKRSTQPTRQSSFLPPSLYTAPILVLTTISPTSLPYRLRIPASVLPLMGSLIGNDYTPLNQADFFFEGGLNSGQKIEKVARVLRETVYSPSHKGNAGNPNNAGDQAVQLVKKVISKLATRGFVSDTQVQEMVDAIIESTFQYILPGLPQHPSTYPFTSYQDHQDDTDENVIRAKEGYASLQKRGLAQALTHAYLFPGKIYLWPILEDTGVSSLRGSDGLRHVRREAYSLLDRGCGGLCWPEPTDEDVQALKEDIELRELLGVTKEIEAILGEEAEKTPSEEATLVSDDAEETDEQKEQKEEGNEEERQGEDELDETKREQLKAIRPRAMLEYGRQGAGQKLAETIVALLSPTDSTMPPCLEPIGIRLKHYLTILSSDTPRILAAPPHLHPLLAATRLCILEAATRSTSYERWRRAEVFAVLKMGLGMHAAWEKEERVFRPRRDGDEGGWPALNPRPMGIMAQLNAVLVEQLLLAETLLILPEDHPAASHVNAGAEESGEPNGQGKKDPRPRLTHLTPFMFFSGVALHTLLDHKEPPSCTGWRWTSTENELLMKCAEAVVEGIEDKVIGWQGSHDVSPKTALPPSPEEKKEKKRKEKTVEEAPKGFGGRFDLLNGMTD